MSAAAPHASSCAPQSGEYLSAKRAPAWLEARAAFDARVLGIVRERGPVTSRDVRNVIGYDGLGHAYERITVGGALQRLQRAGLVTGSEVRKVGARVRYRAATAVSA